MDNINKEQDSVIPITISKPIDTVLEPLKTTPSQLDIKKNNSRQKPLTRTLFIRKKLETYSMDDLGSCEKAKKHQKANRPLRQIGDINENVNFCHCCDLPCEKEGIIVPFKVCDNADDFAECGLGISLYFFFFKFVMFISFLGVLCLTILLMILNINYSSEIKDVCKYNNTAYDCYGYMSGVNSDENFYKKFNQWLQRLSSDHVFIYRKLPKQLRGADNEKIDDVLVNFSLVNFIFLITTFILNIIFLFLIRAQIKRLKLKNRTIRDYTVLISNAKNILTSYIDHKNQVKVFNRTSQIEVENFQDFKIYVSDFLRGNNKLNDIKIEHINICYRLGNYLSYMNQFDEVKRKIFQINYNPYTQRRNKGLAPNEQNYYNYLLSFIGIYCCCGFKGKSLEELSKDKDELDNKLKAEEQRVNGIIKEEDFTNYMLVSFNRIEDKERFLSHYSHDFCSSISFFLCNIKYYLFGCCVEKEDKEKFWRQRSINAKDPPEPDDIYWENFSYTFVQRMQRTIITYIICIFIIIISFGLVFGLSLLQENLYKDDKDNTGSNIFLKYLTSLSITIAISIINTVIQTVLEKLTFHELPISKSNYILSLSIKISIFTFLNSAIIPLISKYIVALSETDNEDDYIDYYVCRIRDNLLIDDLFVYFIVNAFVTPLLWVLNFPFWFKKLKICCIERHKNPDQHHYMTQKDLNALYEYPDMDLAYKLSYLVKSLSMCFFYFPIFPMGFVIAFIGFIFAYWVEKYVLTHQCKRPDMLDEIIEKYYANYFIVVLFIGGIGDYIFLHNAFDTNSWTLINIIVFGVLIVIPYTKLIICNYVDAQGAKFRYRDLSEVYFTFYNDYQRENPLTKKLGLETYLKELRKNDYLSDNAYNIVMENIDKLNLMEMYYGIKKNNMPLVHQSIQENIKADTIASVQNLRGTFLGGGGLVSTIVRPELRDNYEEKRKKKEFFESQIMNMFGKTCTNKDIKKDKNEFNDDVLNIPISVSNLPEHETQVKH